MSDNTGWANVNVDEYGHLTCPIPNCGEELYLIRSTNTALAFMEQPERSDWITESWQVECVNGHVIQTHVDRALELGEDTSGEHCPPYDHRSLHRLTSKLEGLS